MEWSVPHEQPLWIAFATRWAICFVVAVGIASVSVSSVRLAVLLVRGLAWAFGAELADAAVPPWC